MARHEDPNWPLASAWLEGACLPEPSGGLTLIGAPSRLGSISPGRSDLAPAAIRFALTSFSSYDATLDADVRSLHVTDLGDLPIADSTIEAAFEPIRSAVRGISNPVILLGGDNSITRPGVHGLGLELNRIGVVTLDAHFDLRDTDRGLTNGNPIRALLADGLPGENVAQIGIQAFANSAEYAAVARDAGIRVVTMDRVHREGVEAVIEAELSRLAERVSAIYVDLDIDVMDRTFSMGTPGSRPGGISPHQFVAAARAFGKHPLVKAVDLVELDPERDGGGATAMAAAMALLAFSAGVVVRLRAAG